MPLTVATPWYMKEEMDGSLTSTGLAHLVPSPTGSALACYPGALPHAAAGEGQVQFSHSCDPRASSLACLRWQGVRRRGTFFSSPMPPLGRWGGQRQLSCSPVLWASSPVPTNRKRSTVLLRWGIGPALLSAAVSGGQSAVPPTTGSEGRGRISPPHLLYNTGDERYGQISLAHLRPRSPPSMGVNSTVLPWGASGPTLPSAAVDEDQVRGRTKSVQHTVHYPYCFLW